jgi:hypothetical protein
MAKTPKMTKAHFQFIADVIASMDTGTLLTPTEVVGAFAHALKATNPAFDSNRFIEACFKEK